ncbi:TIR domain-containing protein [Mycolicibacterium mucogenicum 261Sha1.1M5]|nr:TIR domain-containing protein [Mycolicibacterium mucogenicum 261Sha1.1M5]
METSLPVEQSEPPEGFLSCSWVSEQHKAWVADLARRLRANGVDVHLDRWGVRLGHDLTLFMKRYADPSARVLVVLSDDYGPKPDSRDKYHSGVGKETTILSATVCRSLGSNRAVPLMPDSGTMEGGTCRTHLSHGQKLDRFPRRPRNRIRTLAARPARSAPRGCSALGNNPFEGRTEAQATAAVRIDPTCRHNGRSSGLVEMNLNQNSGHFALGNDEASFALSLDYPYGGVTKPGEPKLVRHYSDRIGNIGLVVATADTVERFADIAKLPMSNRVERAEPGDTLVMLNRNGYWSLLLLDGVIFRSCTNGYETIAQVRYAIAMDRSASLTLDSLPPMVQR